MTFAVPGKDYDGFMGRYSTQLAPLFADFCGIGRGARVLDVGCGPGALASLLAQRVGESRVSGVEPSASFVEACRARLSAADIRLGGAEQLPWADGEFDAALAQLVLPFVHDARQVACEMQRVVRPGGTLAACMWLAADGMQLTHLFWEAAGTLEPALRDTEARMPFRRAGEIAELWRAIGLQGVEETTLEVRTCYRDFDELWSVLEHAAGPIGSYMTQTDAARRTAIRAAYLKLLGTPAGAIELSGRAAAARAQV